MPCYLYECPTCGGSQEVTLPIRRDLETNRPLPPSIIRDCSCGGQARLRLQPFGISGMEDHQLEDISRKVGGHAGMFRSSKELEQWEESKGFTRRDVNDPLVRRILDDQREEAHELEVATRAGGREGREAYLEQAEVREITGWTQGEYQSWKAKQDAAEQSLAAEAP